MSEEKIEYKVSVPMFEDGELEIFDNNIHSIIEEYSKMMFKEKDQILTQRIIIKQEQEIDNLKSQLQQKENIIKEVREEVKEARLWNWTEQKILIDKFTKRLLEILDKEK